MKSTLRTPAVFLSAVILAALAPHTPCAGAELPIAVNLTSPAGPYTKAHWKADWPGCEFEDGVSEGHVERVNDADGTGWLRVNYAPGGIGPEQGGTGWRWPVGKHEAAELEYTVRFGPDFEFVKGGKLPGLCGGPENVSGGRPATGENGFSARLMWRRDGRGEAYIYHMDQPEKYGHSFPFPEDFRFVPGTPVKVRLVVVMNTPGRRDGQLMVWTTLPGQGERLMVEQKAMAWRAVDIFGVDGLYFETFHGGSDNTWAPTRPCHADFTGLRLNKVKVRRAP